MGKLQIQRRLEAGDNMIHRTCVAIVLIACLPNAFAQGLADPEQVQAELEACMEVDDVLRDTCTDAVLQRIPEETKEDAARQAAFQDYQHAVATELARSDQPRKLALAAVLETFSGFQLPGDQVATAGSMPSIAQGAQIRANDWRKAAAQRAGQDVITNILLMFGDGSNDGAAVRNAAAARWASAEPDNVAPLFHGDAGVDMIIAAATHRSGFDLHAYDTVRWMIEAFAALPPPLARWMEAQDEEVDIETFHALRAMGLWTAVAIPALQPISETCRGYAAGASTQRRFACRRLAQVLAESSDTHLGQLFGIALLEDTAGTPAERADARAQRRRFDWRMQQWIEVSRGLPNDGATDFARLLRDPSIRTEEQLMLRQLRDAGVAIDPPAGWESPRGERPPPPR